MKQMVPHSYTQSAMFAVMADQISKEVRATPREIGNERLEWAWGMKSDQQEERLETETKQRASTVVSSQSWSD
jgi:hypothetical protein